MKKAEVKAVLSLNNVPFLNGIKKAGEVARKFAQQLAKNPIQTTFLAGAVAAQKSMKLVAGVAVAAFAAASAAVLGVVGALGVLSVKAIGAASEIEDFQTTFKVFLGSAEKAKERMAELVKFAADTPFELPEVAEASKTLEVLTGGLLSTGQGLKMVGDIASGVGRNFGEVADMVGKLFTGIREGGEIGETLRSLQLMGALTPKSSRRIQATAGVDNAEAWRLAQKELARFDGMMRERSRTWSGLMSNFQDSIRKALAAFGKPLLESLKPTLDLLSAVVQRLTPEIAEWGKVLAKGVKFAIGIFEQSIAHPSQLLDLFVTGMKAAGSSFLELLETGLARITKNFAGAFGGSGLAKLMGFDPSKLVYEQGESSAAKFWKEFQEKAKAMSQAGKSSIEDMLPDPQAAAKKVEEKKFKSTARLMAGSLSSGGLGASDYIGDRYGPNKAFKFGDPLAQGARRTVGSLLSRGERRANSRALRIDEMAKNFARTGQFNPAGSTLGTVHRGDRAAATALARKNEREKTGIERTNKILEEHTGKFDELLKLEREVWTGKN